MEHVNLRNSSFQFPSLGQDTESIRLLRLLPGNDAETIRCSLKTYQISNSDPVYTALSYTWDLGTSTETREIYINGNPFWIFANLHAFLGELRARGCHDSLWADAICINQTDLEEKTVQVALMSSIFTSAHQVFAWLGPEADGSAEVIDQYNALALLTGALVPLKEKGSRTLSPYYDLLFKGLRQNLPGASAKPQLDAKPFWQPTMSLLRRPYWTRIWIIQEISLSQNEILFFCGDRILSWSALLSLERYKIFLEGSEQYSEWDSSSFRRYQRLKQAEAPRSLDYLLLNFGNLDCTDLRDRVYGLLGLINHEPDQNRLKPDYSLSRYELFIRMTMGREPVTRYGYGYFLSRILKLGEGEQMVVPESTTHDTSALHVRQVLSELRPTILERVVSVARVTSHTTVAFKNEIIEFRSRESQRVQAYFCDEFSDNSQQPLPVILSDGDLLLYVNTVDLAKTLQTFVLVFKENISHRVPKMVCVEMLKVINIGFVPRQDRPRYRSPIDFYTTRLNDSLEPHALRDTASTNDESAPADHAAQLIIPDVEVRISGGEMYVVMEPSTLAQLLLMFDISTHSKVRLYYDGNLPASISTERG